MWACQKIYAIFRQNHIVFFAKLYARFSFTQSTDVLDVSIRLTSLRIMSCSFGISEGSHGVFSWTVLWNMNGRKIPVGRLFPLHTSLQWWAWVAPFPSFSCLCISALYLLGYGAVRFTQNAQGLTIDLPESRTNAIAPAFRITTTKGKGLTKRRKK